MNYLQPKILLIIFISILIFKLIYDVVRDSCTSLNIEDDYIEKKVFFNSKKIYYTNISSVSFFKTSGGRGSGPSACMKIIDKNGSNISFLIFTLSDENIKKLFNFLINNVDLYKNNEDFIKISKGDFELTQDTHSFGLFNSNIFLRLAESSIYNQSFFVILFVCILVFFMMGFFIFMKN